MAQPSSSDGDGSDGGNGGPAVRRKQQPQQARPQPLPVQTELHLPVTADSTLAELRAFIEERALPVNQNVGGHDRRTKVDMYNDIVRVLAPGARRDASVPPKKPKEVLKEAVTEAVATKDEENEDDDDWKKVQHQLDVWVAAVQAWYNGKANGEPNPLSVGGFPLSPLDEKAGSTRRARSGTCRS